MPRLPIVLVAALAAFALPATAEARELRAFVGPGFEIGLLDESGQPVRNLDPGTHTIVVDDRSEHHNFALSGPGVSRRTAVGFVGRETWTVTLAAGTYRYVCDPHADSMRGSFVVGTPSPPSPPSPPVRPRRLVATVGPGFAIALRTAAGARVRRLRAGTYTILVRDRSRAHNFHLVGPGVNRKTRVGFTGTTTWRVTLRAGVHRFVCDPHARGMRGVFRVVR